MNAKEIKSHIWITYQGADGVMARIVEPVKCKAWAHMCCRNRACTWCDDCKAWPELSKLSFPILNTTEINLEIQGEALELVWQQRNHFDRGGEWHEVTKDNRVGNWKIREVLMYTPKQTPKADSEKNTIPVKELYIILDVSANIVGDVVYVDKAEADRIANKNSFGSHFVVRLDEHVSAMQSWYEKGVDKFYRDEQE